MRFALATTTFLFTALSASLTLTLTVAVEQTCDPGIVQVVRAVSDLQNVPSVFTGILGGTNNGSGPATDLNGHRSVNWDAAVVPFNMPGNFFSTVVDRGMTVVSDENKFAVSNPDPNGIEDDLFSSINPEASQGFSTFSPERLFSPLGTKTFSVTFTIPGSNEVGGISGFGAMFVDVDRTKKTKMTFYDRSGCEVVSEYVQPNPKGLSFLGIKLQTKVVGRVEITLGTGKLDRNNNKNKDIVVMDDFFFDEPNDEAE